LTEPGPIGRAENAASLSYDHEDLTGARPARLRHDGDTDGTIEPPSTRATAAPTTESTRTRRFADASATRNAPEADRASDDAVEALCTRLDVGNYDVSLRRDGHAARLEAARVVDSLPHLVQQIVATDVAEASFETDLALK
jgi:hypothetical protein